MKMPLHKFLCTICLVSVVAACSPETGIFLGPDVALPKTSHLKSQAGTGWGGAISLQSPWSKHVAGTATVSYLSFAQQTHTGFFQPYTSKWRAIPVQIGLKYYPLRNDKSTTGLYAAAQAGIMATTYLLDYQQAPDLKRTLGGISVAPGLGYQHNRLDAAFRLQYNLSEAGFQVFYLNFSLAYALLKKKNKV